MKYILDTNICIYIIKNKPLKVIEALKKVEIGQICLSVITLAELEYGVEKSQQREKNKLALTGFLIPFEILPFPLKAATKFGEIRAFLEKKGKSVGAYDLLIGAHALSEDAVLVTNNIKDFSNIPNLLLENWAE